MQMTIQICKRVLKYANEGFSYANDAGNMQIQLLWYANERSDMQVLNM